MSIPSLVRYTLATASILILSITSTNYAHALDNQSTIGITLSSPKLELPKLTTSKFYTSTKQTIAVTTNNELGYTLSLSSKDNETGLVNKAKNQTIKTTNGTLDTPSTLTENTWGYTLDNTATQSTKSWIGLTNKDNPQKIKKTETRTDSDTTEITYGVNLSQANDLKSGEYTNQVTYTATVNLPTPTPTTVVSTIKAAGSYPASPNYLTNTSGNDGTVNITGTNMNLADTIYVDINKNNQLDSGEECRDITTKNNSTTELTCTMPTDTYRRSLGLAPANPGTYDVHVIGNEDKKIANALEYKAPTTPTGNRQICQNADTNSSCIVDLDNNMIPIKYIGTHSNAKWAVVTNNELNNTKGSWYNYLDKKWANAVTVKADKLSKYQSAKAGNNPNIEIDENDVLGYWTYIPRYAYEVMRPNAIDKVVQPEDFQIYFEKNTDTKKTPQTNTSACNTIENTTLTAKDYRTDCATQLGISRIYGAATNTTWATHPAFTWGSKELNGLWVGKFEMTGKRTAPTVMPNQVTNIYEYIGNIYTMAKSIGVNDPVNTYGNNISGITQNSHNLAKATSRMMKNSEWGATSYLSSSMYGAGVNNVQINSAMSYSDGTFTSRNQDQDGQDSYSAATGCGPSANGDASMYEDGTKLDTTTISSLTACSQDTERSYSGSLGQLASTTNNIYGIYDMSGGAWDYVMGNVSTSATATSDSSHITNLPIAPYVDIYRTDVAPNFSTKPAWSSSTSEYHYNNDVCTWQSCGGHALSETKTVQSVSSYNQSWGGEYSNFAYSFYPWFERGGGAGSSPGLFYSHSHSGDSDIGNGGRALLLAGAQ